ncbi:MAG: hypothetical protein RBS36_10285 [Thiomicrospira sp.]|jgi:hypothetical protein|nr:hypothetical protein [Thiomicrospira sp.]
MGCIFCFSSPSFDAHEYIFSDRLDHYKARLERLENSQTKTGEYKSLVIQIAHSPSNVNQPEFVGFRLMDNSKQWFLHDGETEKELRARVDAEMKRERIRGMIIPISVYRDDLGHLHSLNRD